MNLKLRLPSLLFRQNRLPIPSQRENDSLPADLVLPVELWDLVFHEVEDTDLLHLAGVCRAFNTLCIGIYLARYNTSAQSLAAGTLSITSHLLRALQILCDAPQITRLDCQWLCSGLCHDLTTLQDLIRRFTSLREILLAFCTDLLYTLRYGSSLYSQRDLLRSFCSMLCTMACKTRGPVVVIAGGLLRGPHATFFTCCANDIAGWRLDVFQFNPGTGLLVWIRKIRRALPGGPSGFPGRTTVRLHTGKTTKEPPLTEIHMVEVLSVRDDPGPFRSYTIIIFNNSFITKLSLHERAHIPVEQLTVMLPHLTFHALLELSLETDGIEPTILGAFLLRHAQLQLLCRPGSSRRQHQEPRYPHLISPPIAHPSLTKVNANGAENINRVMDGLHSSPLLRDFSFWSETGLVGMNPAFHLLSRRSTDAELSLWLCNKVSEDPPFMDGEETVEIARVLHCISSVTIRCWSPRMAVKTLPWLAVLPALRSVSFQLYLRTPSRLRRHGQSDPQVQVQLAEFMVQANAALAHVPDVVGHAS
ncbi:hypothetical protein B0H17DRAFT_1040112 [Mycena rosella]|uniref:F-box domain-containing protein n=1 Tax=Mycena rosella TaxID=1033263 RepID=A0AAD7M6N9_MYCRO|nr:hypothetical protein B0H17DRAFT_1040112 [Mycena rosella]